MRTAAAKQLARWLPACWLLAPAIALAHVGQGDIGGGFIAGIEHPIFGLDHVIALGYVPRDFEAAGTRLAVGAPGGPAADVVEPGRLNPAG